MPDKKLIVVGGGAAGIFCAVNAASMNRGLKVVIVEKTGKLLSKVRISGGGRCNVTHACFDREEMSRKYPRGGNFVKKAFHRFFTTDTIQWFAEKGVQLKEEPDGRMFPVTDSSLTIIDCLLKETNKYGIEIMMNAEVKKLTHTDGTFDVLLADQRHLSADFVCIASGGYPKSLMFEWLKELGHSIEEPVPSLFTFNLSARPALADRAGEPGTPGHPITQLMGVSVENASIKITGTKLEQNGPLLITHWGLSGPAVLKLSAWGARELKLRNWEFSISINWLPLYTGQQLAAKFQSLRFGLASQKVYTKNPFGLPARLWEFLLNESDVQPDRRWADLSTREANRVIKNITAGEFAVKGKTTFKEEFVTAGGIKLNEVDHNTMMSKKIPGLYFAGEVLDVDGITGGFNFQHAWTSGYIAAKAIAGQAG